MASNALCALCGLIVAAVVNFYGVSAQKSQCSSSEFWSSDLDVCVPCESCKKYPKTPSCNTCKPSKRRERRERERGGAALTSSLCNRQNPLKKLPGHFTTLKTSPHLPLETDVTEPRSDWCRPRRREPLDHFNLFDRRVKSSHARDHKTHDQQLNHLCRDSSATLGFSFRIVP